MKMRISVIRNWSSAMLFSPLYLGLWFWKIVWRIVNFPVNKYRTLQSALRDGKIELEEMQEKCQQLSADKKQLHDQIVMLEESSRLIHAEKELLRQRLDEMTANMACIMVRENKGGFEFPSDPLNPTKIVKKLTKLYEEQALSIVEMFGDKEIEGVEFIANILQESFKFCRTKAHMQILTFTSTLPPEDNHQEDENADNGSLSFSQVLTDTEINDMYLLRWKTATSETFRDQIRKDFKNFATNNIDDGIKLKFQENRATNILMSFICDCADISWLIVTCHPPLKMRFDVKHKMYEGWIQRNFRKYTTKTAVAMCNYPKGFIVSVAWPAIVSADDSLLHQRGEVITID